MRRFSFALPFALLFASGPARAQGVSIASIDYAAPAGCPRGEAFAAELAARAPDARLVAPAQGVRMFVVRITPVRSSGYAGRLTVRETDGTETERAVAGETCASVVTALAVIGGVALSPSDEATTPAPSEATAPSAKREPTAPIEPARPRPPPSRTPIEEPPVAPPTAEGHSAWSIAAGVHGGIVTGIVREALVVVPVFAEVERASPSLLSPSARLRVGRTGSGTVTSDETTARAQVTWTAASIDVCPMVLRAGAFDARPCVRVEGGFVDAAAVDVSPSRSATRPWLDAGPLARARVVVAGPLFVEVEAALNVAVVRDRYFVEPGATLFRPAPVGGTFTAGAGIAFFRGQ